MKQYRISINGTFQFAVSSDESAEKVADRAYEAMCLRHHRAVISTGQINFVPRAS